MQPLAGLTDRAPLERNQPGSHNDYKHGAPRSRPVGLSEAMSLAPAGNWLASPRP